MADINPPRGVVPHLVCDGAAKAIEFYKKAFGATEFCASSMPGSDKIMHAELEIGGSRVYLCDDFSEMCGGQSRSPLALGTTSVTLHQNVADCDAAFDRAVEAGAEVVMPCEDQFWGDRYGVVKDPFGHMWSFSTHVKDVTPQETERAAKAAFGG